MAHDNDYADLFENLRIELRSGCLVVAALSQLHTEHYGSTLRRALVDAGLEVEESTLYPLLRRLEGQGLLTSEWREEDSRRKRFYRISPLGRRMLKSLVDEWDGINRALVRIRRQAA